MVGTTYVYDAFSKTVLQCFCRTCQVNVGEKKGYIAPATSNVIRRPPQKVSFLATEVRAREEAKGGLKYELVLAEAVSPAPMIRSTKRNTISGELIQNKLQAAEDRRMSLDAERLNNLIEQRNRILEAKEKKEEFNNNFMQSTRETLEQQMELKKENRENYLKSVQGKVRDHVLKVEEVKKTSNTPPKQEALQSINKKLDTAAVLRDAQIAVLMERLKEHDEHIVSVRSQIACNAKHLREKLMAKLEGAEDKRAAVLREIQEKVREHDRHVNQVRKQTEVQSDCLREKLFKKLEVARENRELRIKEIQDKHRQHDHHVEEVRKKAALNNGNINTSG